MVKINNENIETFINDDNIITEYKVIPEINNKLYKVDTILQISIFLIIAIIIYIICVKYK
jgi:hypothetical protein